MGQGRLTFELLQRIRLTCGRDNRVSCYECWLTRAGNVHKRKQTALELLTLEICVAGRPIFNSLKKIMQQSVRDRLADQIGMAVFNEGHCKVRMAVPVGYRPFPDIDDDIIKGRLRLRHNHQPVRRLNDVVLKGGEHCDGTNSRADSKNDYVTHVECIPAFTAYYADLWPRKSRFVLLELAPTSQKRPREKVNRSIASMRRLRIAADVPKFAKTEQDRIMAYILARE